MTLLHAPVPPPTPTAVPPPSPIVGAEHRLTLTGISWQTYVHLCDDVGPATRITYDRGRMEIVMPSELHELAKKCLARIVEAYAEAAKVQAEGVGSWTLRREDLARGLEPDECFYVANAAHIIAVRRQRRLDLMRDPPPDLAIEVDLSPADVAKPPIYAVLGIPEIWRFDGEHVAYLTRSPDGQYAAVDRSTAFPDLPATWVREALAIGLDRGQQLAAVEIRRRMAAAHASP